MTIQPDNPDYAKIIIRYNFSLLHRFYNPISYYARKKSLISQHAYVSAIDKISKHVVSKASFGSVSS